MNSLKEVANIDVTFNDIENIQKELNIATESQKQSLANCKKYDDEYFLDFSKQIISIDADEAAK